MYIVLREDSNKEIAYFGPFPTEARALEYARSFERRAEFVVKPIIVPNCVQVKLNY